MIHIIREFQFRSGKAENLEEYTEKALTELGKCVIYKGVPFEWVMYNQGIPPLDFKLLYTEIPDYSYHLFKVDEVISMEEETVCQCGARKLGHPAHSHWCDAHIGIK